MTEVIENSSKPAEVPAKKMSAAELIAALQTVELSVTDIATAIKSQTKVVVKLSASIDKLEEKRSAERRKLDLLHTLRDTYVEDEEGEVGDDDSDDDEEDEEDDEPQAVRAARAKYRNPKLRRRRKSNWMDDEPTKKSNTAYSVANKPSKLRGLRRSIYDKMNKASTVAQLVYYTKSNKVAVSNALYALRSAGIVSKNEKTSRWTRSK